MELDDSQAQTYGVDMGYYYIFLLCPQYNHVLFLPLDSLLLMFHLASYLVVVLTCVDWGIHPTQAFVPMF